MIRAPVRSMTCQARRRHRLAGAREHGAAKIEAGLRGRRAQAHHRARVAHDVGRLAAAQDLRHPAENGQGTVRHDMARRGHRLRGGQDLGEPEGVDAPPIARVKPGRPRVDEREPAAGPDAGRPVLQDLGQRAPSGHPPAGQAPVVRLVCAQDQGEVDGPVGDRGEADGYRAPGAATPAALGHEVRRQPRTEQSRGVDIDRRRASDGRASTLELVDRQIDAVRAESPQRLLEALPRDEPLEVPELAARQPKQLAVGAHGVLVDAPANQVQEVGLPPLETLLERGPRSLDPDRVPEQAGQSPDQAGAHREVCGRQERIAHRGKGPSYRVATG